MRSEVHLDRSQIQTKISFSEATELTVALLPTLKILLTDEEVSPCCVI